MLFEEVIKMRYFRKTESKGNFGDIPFAMA